MLDAISTHAWLIAEGLAGSPIPALMEGFCGRLAQTSLAIERAHVSIQLLHPAIRGYSLTWSREDAAIHDQLFRRGEPDGTDWQQSPMKRLLDSGERRLRIRLTDVVAAEFPVLLEFRDQGMTDWVAFVHSFDPAARVTWQKQIGMITTWTTARREGFTDADLESLRELVGTFALACKAETTREIAGNLMTAYIGGDAAKRVLAGEITRGSVDHIAAAILFADLRGFTTLSETMPIEAVVGLLNDCFDAMGAPVGAAGGEILKFLGDGMLAVFPVADEVRDACRCALGAAEAAQAAMTALQERRGRAGQPMLKLDLALHLGEVAYGNVGTAERLDFTVIGPAVNEASRIEGLCKRLDRGLLLSASFARGLGGTATRLCSLGLQQLAGVAEPIEIFGVE